MSAPLSAALAAAHAGLSVVPPRQDGSKAPEGFWKRWQTEIPDEATIRGWYASGRRSGVGYVCGAVSGNLELFEFDDDASRYGTFKATAEALGLGELVERIEAGYLETSPNGGVHWLYRCDEIAGNTKLASRPKLPAERKEEHDDTQVMIETRGQGGYVVVAPSNGSVHPSGGSYQLIRGSVTTIATITVGERRALWKLAETFDEIPESEPTPVPTSHPSGTGLSVIDDFNARTTWRELLEPDGWTLVHERGVAYWRRPGKDRGWSAISGYNVEDRFACYSTSTDLEPNKGYSKFGYYAHRHHGNDFGGAVRELSGSGYGDRPAPTSVRAQSASTPTGMPWPEPARVLGLPVAPTLDLSLFPLEVANVALDASERLQCPPDYPAWALTVSMAGLIGAGAGIRPRQYDDWTERACLWTALVGPPSWMKSPALDIGRRPLRRQEAIDHERYEREHAAWKSECDAIRAQAKRGQKPECPDEPAEARWTTSDATIEKLGTMMVDARGLTLVRDELTGWVGSFNRYSRAEGDRQFFLECYSGGPYTVDRIGRGTIHIPDVYLNILGGAQPERARDIFGEGPDDGFAARVTAIYPDMPADYREVDRWPDKDARAALDAVSDRLVAASWDDLLLKDEWKPLPYCRLSPEAGTFWSEWHTDLMGRLRVGEWEGRHAGRVGKYPGLAARLALVWHLLEWGARRISDERIALIPAMTMAKVLDVMTRYIAPMDTRVYRAFDRTQAANGGERIARWIAEKQPASFTLREIRRHAWSGLTEPEAVEASTEWLAAMGWVREADPEQRPGRPSNRFDVNPRVWEVEHDAAA